MNDFTKEELEELQHCIYAYRDLCDEDVDDSLCDKLQSMIDNYCEHDGEIGKDYPAEKCMKCGRYWE